MIMKREINLELGKRIAWLRETRNLVQKEAAQEIGIAYPTYQHYEYGYHPSRKNIELISNYYTCNRTWLLAGEGEPFPGAREKYPEVCGPSTSPETAPESPTRTPAFTIPPAANAGEIPIADAVAAAIQILTSHTSYAAALFLSIRSFADALSVGSRSAVALHLDPLPGSAAASPPEEAQRTDSNQEIKALLQGMNEKISALQKEISALQKLKEPPTPQKQDWSKAESPPPEAGPEGNWPVQNVIREESSDVLDDLRTF